MQEGLISLVSLTEIYLGQIFTNTGGRFKCSTTQKWY